MMRNVISASRFTKTISGRIIALIIFSCVILHLSGCTSSPLKYFPNFPAKKLVMNETALMGDVFIVDDISGDTNKVEVTWNREIGDSVLDLIARKLKNKGFVLRRTMLTSVGLMVSRSQVFKVGSTYEDHDTDEEILPSGRPPFYVHEDFQRDTAAKQSLASVYRSLIQASPEGGAEHTVIQDAAMLCESSGVNSICIFFVGGFNVPVTQRIKDEDRSIEVAGGAVGVERVSRVSMAFFIIDATGGELIWADHLQTSGGIVHLEKVERLASGIIDRIP